MLFDPLIVFFALLRSLFFIDGFLNMIYHNSRIHLLLQIFGELMALVQELLEFDFEFFLYFCFDLLTYFVLDLFYFFLVYFVFGVFIWFVCLFMFQCPFRFIILVARCLDDVFLFILGFEA